MKAGLVELGQRDAVDARQAEAPLDVAEVGERRAAAGSTRCTSSGLPGPSSAARASISASCWWDRPCGVDDDQVAVGERGAERGERRAVLGAEQLHVEPAGVALERVVRAGAGGDERDGQAGGAVARPAIAAAALVLPTPLWPDEGRRVAGAAGLPVAHDRQARGDVSRTASRTAPTAPRKGMRRCGRTLEEAGRGGARPRRPSAARRGRPSRPSSAARRGAGARAGRRRAGPAPARARAPAGTAGSNSSGSGSVSSSAGAGRRPRAAGSRRPTSAPPRALRAPRRGRPRGWPGCARRSPGAKGGGRPGGRRLAAGDAGGRRRGCEAPSPRPPRRPRGGRRGGGGTGSRASLGGGAAASRAGAAARPRGRGAEGGDGDGRGGLRLAGAGVLGRQPLGRRAPRRPRGRRTRRCRPGHDALGLEDHRVLAELGADLGSTSSIVAPENCLICTTGAPWDRDRGLLDEGGEPDGLDPDGGQDLVVRQDGQARDRVGRQGLEVAAAWRRSTRTSGGAPMAAPAPPAPGASR